jgi:hypothetical protein
VDLVEEQDRAAAVLAEAFAGALDDLAHVLHTGVDGGHLLERSLRGAGGGERERRLAGSRRSPEDRTGQPILLDEDPERPSRTDEVILPDDLVDRARAQTRGER